MRYAVMGLAVVLTLGIVLWFAWLCLNAVDRRRLQRRRVAEEASGYRTVCVYVSEDDRFLVRKPIAELKATAEELEIPEFLRVPRKSVEPVKPGRVGLVWDRLFSRW